jgi:2-keto-4-pentenoate hydratase/2-oxohepta-3-ene-1,7-dioic acid hydratase in catechol pathway
MTFGPASLISFVSHVMPLHPGDVLCTGTPGAVVITEGDDVTASIDGVTQTTHRVVSSNNSRSGLEPPPTEGEHHGRTGTT